VNLKEILNILTLLSPATLIAGVIIGLINYRERNVVGRAITIYMLLMLLVDLASRIFEYYYKNNLIILVVYSLLELLLFTYFFYKYFFKARHRIVFVICVLSALYILWELFTFKRMAAKDFQSYAKVADNFTVITLVLAFYYERINRFRESKWDYFQLNAIILIFFSVTLIFFLPFNFIINISGLQFYFWLGILLTTVLFYLYLTWYLWKNGRTRRS